MPNPWLSLHKIPITTDYDERFACTFWSKELMPALNKRLAWTRNVKKKNNKSWSEGERFHQMSEQKNLAILWHWALKSKHSSSSSCFSFNENSHRHQICFVSVCLHVHCATTTVLLIKTDTVRIGWAAIYSLRQCVSVCIVCWRLRMCCNPVENTLSKVTMLHVHICLLLEEDLLQTISM